MERLEATIASGRPRRGLVRMAVLLEGSGRSSLESALERLRFGRKEIAWSRRFLAGLPSLRELEERWTDLEIHRFYRRSQGAGVETALVAHFLDGLPREELLRLLDARFRRREQIVDPDPLVTGRDLTSILQIPPGPRIGELLERLREARVTGEVETREQALDLARHMLATA